MSFKRLGGLFAVHRETWKARASVSDGGWAPELVTVSMDGEMVPRRMEGMVLHEFVFLILHQVLSQVPGTIQITSCLRKNKGLHPEDGALSLVLNSWLRHMDQ